MKKTASAGVSRIFFVLFVFFLSLLALPSCGRQDDENTQDASSLFSEAGRAYESGDLISARDLLVRVVELDPENPNAWRNLGTVNLDMGNYNDAVDAYQRVLETDSSRVDVLTDVTGALLGAGRLDEALHVGSIAVQLFPEDGLAFNNYGMALFENGNFQDAAIAFNTALRREPDNPSVLYNCGRVAVVAGDIEGALDFFERASEKDPFYVAPRIEIARTLGMLGRHAEAGEQALAVLAEHPDNLEAKNILALAYSAQNRQADAIEVLEDVLSDNPQDARSRLGLAECLYRNGDFPSSLENYRLFMESLEDTSGTAEIRARIEELEAIID